MKRPLIALAAALAVAGCGTATGPADETGETGAIVEPSAWRRVPAGPLSPRSNPTVVWTGTEVLVFGGESGRPCPPGASCVGPERLLSDAAAYDPGAGTWRTLSPAPEPVHGNETAVLAGTTVYVTPRWTSPEGPAALLAYDVTADAWAQVAWPARAHGRIVAAGDRPVSYQPSHESEAPRPATALDPATGRWEPLPADPLGAMFDRRMVWTGDGLVLFGHELVPNPGAEKPSVTRAAVLADPFGPEARWRPLPDSEILAAEPWLVDGDRLVNPSLGGADGGQVGNWGRTYPFGGVLDVAAGRWSALPTGDQPAHADLAGAFAGNAAVYVGLRGAVLDVEGGRWRQVPPPPGTPDLTGAGIVAAGAELFAFGGSEWRGENGTERNTGWIWTPRG